MTPKQISTGELPKDARKKESEERAERNPCRKEQALSLRCLDEHYFSRQKCEEYFTNYKICKAFWSFVAKQRKMKGIVPTIPPPDERAQVKAEYLPHFRW